jgi:predicted secreted hydrolase
MYRFPLVFLVLFSGFACSNAPVANTDAGSAGDSGMARDASSIDSSIRDTSTELCREDSQVGLPADDSVHAGEVTEWWYWTGHLQDTTGRWFGYQVTFFVFGFGGMLMNVALTDVNGAVFHRDAQFVFERPEIVANAYRFTFDNVSGEGGNGADHLTGTFDGVSLDLTLEAVRTPVLHHGDGREDYPFGGFTYYYSRTRMETTGTITIDGSALEVSGTSWFDHQWGDLAQVTMLGWDWFAIQLEDGRDIMLFLVHGPDGYAGGTISDATCGGARELTATEINVTSRGTWTSPNSGCTYPLGWDVEVDGMNLGITPVMEAQEHPNSRDVTQSYWEGAATVSGDGTGRAYVELTGHCGGQDLGT